MNERLVTIGSYTHATDAHIARTKLEFEGIRAILLDEAMVTMNWFYSNALGGVKVQVFESDAEMARKVLDIGLDPLRSQHTTLNGVARYWWIALIAMFVIAFFMVGLR